MSRNIIGYLYDKTGAVPDGAHIIATHHGGAIYEVDASGGQYNITVGAGGVYQVDVYKSGYINISQDGITVSTADPTSTTCNFNEASGFPLRGCMEGTVLDENSNVIKDATVWGVHRIGSRPAYGCVADSVGYYVLPLHKEGLYDIYVGKHNYYVQQYGSTITLPDSLHPTSTVMHNFELIRRESDCIPVNGRSTILYDDMSAQGEIGYDRIAEPNTVNTATVYVWVRKIGSGAAYSTSSGFGFGEGRCGSGGTNYDGASGDHPGGA